MTGEPLNCLTFTFYYASVGINACVGGRIIMMQGCYILVYFVINIYHNNYSLPWWNVPSLLLKNMCSNTVHLCGWVSFTMCITSWIDTFKFEALSCQLMKLFWENTLQSYYSNSQGLVSQQTTWLSTYPLSSCLMPFIIHPTRSQQFQKRNLTAQPHLDITGWGIATLDRNDLHLVTLCGSERERERGSSYRK